MNLTRLISDFPGELAWLDRLEQEVEVTSISMIKQGEKFQPGVLYIGNLSDVPKEAEEGTTFLCGGNQGKLMMPTGKKNLIFADIDVTDILNFVYPYFESSVFNAEAVEKLTLVSISDSGLVPLLEMLHQISGIHVCIIDNFGKMIAYNTALQEVHDELVEAIYDERMAEEQLRRLEQTYPDYNTGNGDVLHFAWAPKAEQYMLLTEITVKGLKVASFAAFVGKEDPINHYALVRFLSHLVILEMKKDKFYLSNESVLETVLLRDLLEGTINSNRINQVLKKINWTTSRWMQLMVIEDENGQLRTKNMRTLSKRLHLLQRDFRSILYKGRLVLLFTGDWQPAMEECRGIGGILEGNNLLAGVSSVYQNLEQTAEAYQQAMKVLDYVRMDKSVGYMAEYRHFMYAIMYDELSSIGDPSHYCHPGVISIANKDRVNQTEMLKTLETYLEYVDDPEMAAKVLDIHKDVLLKRIDKLKRAHRLDLTSGTERMQIMMTIKFLQSPKIRVDDFYN